LLWLGIVWVSSGLYLAGSRLFTGLGQILGRTHFYWFGLYLVQLTA